MKDPKFLDSLKNPEFIDVDPLKDSYTEKIVKHPDRTTSIKTKNSALVCIDLQYLDAAPGHGVFADALKSGVPLEAQEYYFSRLKEIALPNVRRLQDCFREHGLEVIHCRIQCLTQDGWDRSPGHKRLGLIATPGSKEADFLPEVAPIGDELVINNTASGVFATTNLDFILKNMGIDALYCVGVYTDECVSTTGRSASDIGYFVTLIDDGCATVTHERHVFTVETLRDRYTRVMSTDQVINAIQAQFQEEAPTA